MVIALFLYLIEKLYTPHDGSQTWAYSYREAASVRWGEQRGSNSGNIDDSVLHGCYFVVRIIIFCRICIYAMQ